MEIDSGLQRPAGHQRCKSAWGHSSGPLGSFEATVVASNALKQGGSEIKGESCVGLFRRPSSVHQPLEVLQRLAPNLPYIITNILFVITLLQKEVQTKFKGHLPCPF